MEDILISVIIPVYNQEKFIDKSIKSATNQNINAKYEVIVVDDGSNDGTLDIVNKISKNDSRIKIFKQKHSGVSCARNLGISKSSGKYICFLDSDDLIFNNYLSTQVNTLKYSPNSDIAICPFMRFTNDKKIFEPGFFYKDSYSLHIFANIIVYLDCCLFKRCVIDKLKNFDISLEANEDYDFLFRSTILNFDFTPNFSTIAVYRYHENNSSKKLNWDDSSYTITKKFDYLIERYIKNFKLAKICGYSICYVIFSSSILGYALKFINKSKQKLDFLINISVKYLLMALSYNDFNLKFYNVINLYMCLIRNLSNNLLQYKQLHKALDRFKYIIPQCFDYEASPEVLKKLSQTNYIPYDIIISTFNSGIANISSLL